MLLLASTAHLGYECIFGWMDINWLSPVDLAVVPASYATFVCLFD